MLAFVTGAGIGAIQASSRTIVGLLAPPDRTAQMFGFWGTFMRGGTLLGLLFGPISDALGTPRAGVFLVLAFFILGTVMLSRVDIASGIRGGGAAG
jgi:UMF1 family MFS transporter